METLNFPRAPVQRKYDVRIGPRLIQTLYSTDQDVRSVRRSLIDHDGLPETISVYQIALKYAACAYSDCARSTHPEEL